MSAGQDTTEISISIHATHAGGDSVAVYSRSSHDISIHATHAGGDSALRAKLAGREISIHATHGGGDAEECLAADGYGISIHATHAGGDASPCMTLPHRCNFNPRHPCGWRRAATPGSYTGWLFQSTPPMRVATVLQGRHHGAWGFQSTPPMRVATYLLPALPSP